MNCTDLGWRIPVSRKREKSKELTGKIEGDGCLQEKKKPFPPTCTMKSRRRQSVIYFCSSRVRTFILGVRFGRSKTGVRWFCLGKLSRKAKLVADNSTE